MILLCFFSIGYSQKYCGHGTGQDSLDQPYDGMASGVYEGQKIHHWWTIKHGFDQWNWSSCEIWYQKYWGASKYQQL